MADEKKEKKKNPFSWKRAGNLLLNRRRQQQAQIGQMFDDEPRKKKGRKVDRLVED